MALCEGTTVLLFVQDTSDMEQAFLDELEKQLGKQGLADVIAYLRAGL